MGKRPWDPGAIIMTSIEGVSSAMRECADKIYELENEVRRLKAVIYLKVMDERNACIGICAKYRGADGDDIANEIESRPPPNVQGQGDGQA